MKDHLFTFSHSLLDDEGDSITNIDMGIQGNAFPWTDVVDRFTEFLRGCGYVFDAHKTLGLVDAS